MIQNLFDFEFNVSNSQSQLHKVETKEKYVHFPEDKVSFEDE